MRPEHAWVADQGHAEFQAPLLPDNGNRAVSVPHHGLRYATHKRSPQPPLPSAANHYQPGIYALGQLDNLFVGPTHPEVCLRRRSAGSVYALHLSL